MGARCGERALVPPQASPHLSTGKLRLPCGGRCQSRGWGFLLPQGVQLEGRGAAQLQEPLEHLALSGAPVSRPPPPGPRAHPSEGSCCRLDSALWDFGWGRATELAPGWGELVSSQPAPVGQGEVEAGASTAGLIVSEPGPSLPTPQLPAWDHPQGR